jgi:hypothetical protein
MVQISSEWILAETDRDRDWLSEGDVVARIPVFLTRHALEILLDKVLPARQSVSRLWQIAECCFPRLFADPPIFIWGLGEAFCSQKANYDLGN